ncbi:potassium transporter Trk [Microbacterium sp. EYE_5]|uniref:potassium transporter Trk n=1 Tax=unclassified Microbacterium TaxID=2609290 RepID=UPI00200364C9|nr:MULTISPECIES: potassium transporter Trk [unclassified Microbacterium]MCK6079691.1 potassium transporter Trk [Microbacterium sp. EYE_382]MCK6084962.1 potassium transporter Trk [Microbacterium sp. EYE_384]MCK6122812.1 potassium transporter Trk [Microbacterium sp. EYE_80]MCK6125725.1 potassium transporter Trk [Microbacterium sp. EYE_79]MCK6140646.1 potassium transporter Trk [Microbacterium sp. EYE_39]
MAEHTETHVESAELRRSPRFGAFFAVGGAFGIVLALILTYAVGTDQISESTGARYSEAQVFGFLLLACIPVGLALGGAVALIFDRVLRRRARSVRIERETVESDD